MAAAPKANWLRKAVDLTTWALGNSGKRQQLQLLIAHRRLVFRPSGWRNPAAIPLRNSLQLVLASFWI